MYLSLLRFGQLQPGLGCCLFLCTTVMSTTAVYNMLQDLRLLARRDSSEHRPLVDRELEQFRLEFLNAFEAFLDLGTDNMQPFIMVANKIISNNKDLIKWLKHQLELEADW